MLRTLVWKCTYWPCDLWPFNSITTSFLGHHKFEHFGIICFLDLCCRYTNKQTNKQTYPRRPTPSTWIISAVFCKIHKIKPVVAAQLSVWLQRSLCSVPWHISLPSWGILLGTNPTPASCVLLHRDRRTARHADVTEHHSALQQYVTYTLIFPFTEYHSNTHSNTLLKFDVAHYYETQRTFRLHINHNIHLKVVTWNKMWVCWVQGPPLHSLPLLSPLLRSKAP